MDTKKNIKILDVCLISAALLSVVLGVAFYSFSGLGLKTVGVVLVAVGIVLFLARAIIIGTVGAKAEEKEAAGKADFDSIDEGATLQHQDESEQEKE